MMTNEEVRLDTQNERGLGLKYDAGKPQARLVFEGFPRTLLALVDVLTMGARKYRAHSWQHVENGIDRYSDAAARHMLARLSGETHDPESGLIHEAHELINRMFVLELKLRQEAAKETDQTSYEKTMSLFEEYSDRIVYDSETEDEALQNAVDWTFRDRTEEFRADLYSRIKEAWDKCAIEARFVISQKIIEESANG